MTDAIRPALTPEEWEEYGNDPVYCLRYEAGNCEYDDGVPYRVRCVALANHALPDGHPNKLTRADVQALRRSRVFEIDPSQVFDGAVSVDREGTERLRSLAARIEALLPPEGV